MPEPFSISLSGAAAPEPEAPPQHPPRVRRGVVARTALVSRLCAAADAPVVTVVAPAGYGKTTLLVQWAERDPRPCTWLSPGSGDLRESLAAACAATSRPQPMLVVLDAAESLAGDAAVKILEAFTSTLPAGSTLALAARSEPRLPLARLRAEGRLFELGPDDLALTRREAQSLLRHAGVLLPEPEVAELERRTEGWPAGLYLAALSLRSGGDPWTFSGDDRHVADYLRAEHLARLAPAVRSFVLRTSVLERMSPAICDAVLERKDSARRLEVLDRSSLLVVPLDRNRRTYRYRRLVRDPCGLDGRVEGEEIRLLGYVVDRLDDGADLSGFGAEPGNSIRGGFDGVADAAHSVGKFPPQTSGRFGGRFGRAPRVPSFRRPSDLPDARLRPRLRWPTRPARHGPGSRLPPRRPG